MYIIRQTKKRFSPTLIFIFIISVGLGISTSYLLGMFFLTFVLGVMYMSNGYIIDKENQRMKNETKFLGFTFGKWQHLPEIKYISLLRVRQTRKSFQPSSAMFVQKTSKNYSYQLNLIINDPIKPRIRLFSGNRGKVIDEGLKLGDYLDLKVYDVTSRDKKWIR